MYFAAGQGSSSQVSKEVERIEKKRQQRAAKRERQRGRRSGGSSKTKGSSSEEGSSAATTPSVTPDAKKEKEAKEAGQTIESMKDNLLDRMSVLGYFDLAEQSNLFAP